jgi:oligopeptide/dipeptide ABC transporter ATP-binding protein
MEPLLEIRDLEKTFKIKNFFGATTEVQALKGISLSIGKGESLGIVGESGCGKSTLANLIIRLDEPTAGSIILAGQDISHLKEKELRKLRSRIQIVFQDPYSSLSPRMTVEQILTEPMCVAGVKTSREMREKAVSLLELVGMRSSNLTRYPHEFSGGQRQRLSIARALTTEPEILILDEPTSALDVSVQAQVLNILTSLQKQMNLTYLFISHNLAVVKYISNRTAVMYRGKIMEIGPSKNILMSPAHPYTKKLLEAVPIVGKPFQQPDTEDVAANEADVLDGCGYFYRCPFAEKKCLEKQPEFRAKDSDHLVACWKV